MKYERGGESHSPGYEYETKNDEFGFGPILFGSTPPPSVGGDAPGWVWGFLLFYSLDDGRAGRIRGEIDSAENNELLQSSSNLL